MNDNNIMNDNNDNELKLYFNELEITWDDVNSKNLVPSEISEYYIKFREPTQQDIIDMRMPIIEARLKKLDQDFRQVDLGAIIPDIEERKAEFIALHNELRQLLDKPAREYKN